MAETEMDPHALLKSLHRAKTVKARAAIIAEVEQRGGLVGMRDGVYVLVLDGVRYSLPRKVCERCKESYHLASYWGGQGAEHPWCLTCRESDPAGAKKAYDRMRFHARYQAWSEAERVTWKKHVKEHEHPKLSDEQLADLAQELLVQLVMEGTERLTTLCAERGLSERQIVKVLRYRDRFMQEWQSSS